MLLATVNDRGPGESFKSNGVNLAMRVRGEVRSAQPMDRIELVWNGDVVRRIAPINERIDGARMTRFDVTLSADGSGWLAARCLGTSQGDAGIPFAHTAPWHVEVAGRPLAPRRREVEYFLGRVEDEIDRNRSILSPEQLAPYLQARDFWREKLARAAD
jgi:hypothetical protein